MTPTLLFLLASSEGLSQTGARGPRQGGVGGCPQGRKHPRPCLKPPEVYLLLAAINKQEKGGGRGALLLPVAN